MDSVLLSVVEFFRENGLTRIFTYSFIRSTLLLWMITTQLWASLGSLFSIHGKSFSDRHDFFMWTGSLFSRGEKSFSDRHDFFMWMGSLFSRGVKCLSIRTINTSHQPWFFSDRLFITSQHGILLSRNWLTLLFIYDFFLLNSKTLRSMTRHFIPPICGRCFCELAPSMSI